MAALIVCGCAFIRELYILSDVFFRCGSVQKSLRYLHNKNRLKLFKKYCEALCQQYEFELLAEFIYDSNLNHSNYFEKIKMRRGRLPPGIDFAAMEATALGLEATDGHYRNSNSESFDMIESPIEISESPSEFEQLGNYGDIEVVDGVEMDVSYYEHIDAHPQATKTIDGELREGVSIIVTGRILLTCERFSINFVIDNPTKDIALHINPRLPQNYIVRNTRVRNVWGREEIATQLPFTLHRGTDFSVQVLVTSKSFLISSNGYHFADYNHRLPFKTIKSIEVKGDVENVKIDTRDVTAAYPERQPQSTCKIHKAQLATQFREIKDGVLPEWAFYETITTDVVIPTQWRARAPKLGILDNTELPMPYIGRLDRNSLVDGCALCITGRIKLLPHSFYINLQDGVNIWPHQNIAFHFNPRFSTRASGTLGRAVVCRNAWYNNGWAKEERSELDTNLRPGKNFVLMIRCTKDYFIVYVDRKLVTSFRYHLEPSIVNTVYIRGDVKLVDVTLKTPTTATNETNITENPAYLNDEFEFLDESRVGAQLKSKGEDTIEAADVLI